MLCAVPGGLPLKVFDVIQNLLDSWLDSKIPRNSCLPNKESICHMICKVTTNNSIILKFTGNLVIYISWDSSDSEIPNKIHGDS